MLRILSNQITANLEDAIVKTLFSACNRDVCNYGLGSNWWKWNGLHSGLQESKRQHRASISTFYWRPTLLPVYTLLCLFPSSFLFSFFGGEGGGISRRAVGGVKNHSVSASYLPPHCCQYTRSFASFLLSHIGLLSLVVGYCIMGAFIFEELEKVGIDKPVNVSLCFLNFYSTMK